MPYAAQSDLLTRLTGRELAQLTNDTPGGSEPNASVVAAALAEASAQVDSWCRTRYQVPLQPCLDATSMTVDIAVYLLYSRRPMKMPENVRLRYEDALALLKAISSGKASLDQPAGQSLPQTPLGNAVIPRNNQGRFSDHDLKGFV